MAIPGYIAAQQPMDIDPLELTSDTKEYAPFHPCRFWSGLPFVVSLPMLPDQALPLAEKAKEHLELK